MGYEGTLFSPEEVEELERRLLTDGVERDD
jgi:hypothetical protein